MYPPSIEGTTRIAARIALATFVLVGLAGCGVNDIPTKEEAAKAAWSQVLNQYKRRADLIPNLVQVVKGFARQEKETLTAVVEARSKVSQMTLPKDILTNEKAFQTFQRSQGNLSNALGRLLLIVERYPELKSAQNFLSLQSQLEGSENRISVARRDYIEAVRDYNTELRTFPGRWWASLLYSDAKPMQNFSVSDPNIADAPKVRFN